METLDESLKSFGAAAAGMMDDWLSMVPIDYAALDDPAEAGRAILRYIEQVQRIGQAAGAAGLGGLASVCGLIETNLLILQDNGKPLSVDMHGRLEELPSLLFNYWAGQANHDACVALLENLSASWPLPFLGEMAEEELRRLTGQEPASDITAGDGEEALHVGPPEGTAQQVDRGMLGLMAHEFGPVAAQLGEDLAGAVAQDTTPQERQAALDVYVEMLQRLGAAVNSVGLVALGALLERIAGQLSPPLSTEQHALLRQLPEKIAAYLDGPAAEDSCATLAEMVCSTAWRAPVPAGDAPRWIGALANVEMTESGAGVEKRPERATAQDVSVELPDDVNSELLEGLLQELPVHTGAFTAAVELIASGGGSVKDLEKAMRAAHTLKGAANTVGVRGIANLAHYLEDILVALIEAERLPGEAIGSLLLQGADCLEAMGEVLLGVGDAPELAQEVLQKVLDCANEMDRRGAAPIPAVTEPQQAIGGRANESGAVDGEGGEDSAAEQAVVIRNGDGVVHPAATSPEHALRVPASVVDELLRLAGETLTSTSQIQEHLRLTTSQSSVIRKQNRLIQQLVAELEELVDIRGVTTAKDRAGAPGEFDALEFEHYSELHTVTHRLVEAATDAQEMADEAERQLGALSEVLEEQRKLQMASQHTVLRTRMVPVASVAARLQRSVRQTARLLDKKVQLTIKGESTNIDGQVLHDLMDPLMHLLRNAVDHGIEAPEDRAAAGKPAEGRIELSFAREGDSIVVRCADDGAGLDYGAIRRMGERKGMVTAGHPHTEDELARLILAPGFSTRNETSQVSGRGVGMDVVYSRVLELKGLLALHSTHGEGLTVELRLPSTLLSTHTLIVRQREKRLAISTRGVEDIRYVTRDQIQEIGPRQFLREGERLHSLVKLEVLLALPGDRRAKDRRGFPVLFTRMADGSAHAVLVQEVLDSREVVMKKFGRYVPRTNGVIGAVILGDGSIAPVVDLVELLSGPRERMIALVEADSAEPATQQPERKVLCALVVDDSLSARRAISQVMKDAGFDVRIANDGLEAASMLQRFVPDIILTDLEMPRMNGLELTAHVRGAERTKAVPIVMITSRSTEKHRRMVAASGIDVHLTKPFNDEALLRHVMNLTNR